MRLIHEWRVDRYRSRLAQNEANYVKLVKGLCAQNKVLLSTYLGPYY